MKKLLLVIASIVLIIFLVLLFFIPTEQPLSYSVIVKNPGTGVARILLNREKWKVWWPGQKQNDTTFTLNNYKYTIRRIMLNSLDMTVYNSGDTVKGSLGIAESGTDSAELKWTSTTAFSNNPFRRISEYQKFRETSDNISKLVKQLGMYFNKEENIYGMKVSEAKVKDSSLISLKQTFNHYPSTDEIYGMIENVNNYIKEKNGEVNDYPMLHVHLDGPNNYETMVAIPTKKELPSEGKFLVKKMVLGNILKAQVKGGVQTIVEGEKELNNYVNDYKKLSPAIPFQSLVTNRSEVKDSTKWITELYYPIFY